MLNYIQMQILVGSLLGDGSLRKKKYGNFNASFVKNQSITDHDGIDKTQYIQWHFDQLLPYSSSIGILKKRDGKDQYEFRTKSFHIFTEIEKKWYIPGERRIKILPEALDLTPLALCVWFMDDGTNYVEKRQAQICTQSFTLEENQRLVGLLRKLDITAKVQEFRGKYNLYIVPETYLTLINTIKPYCKWNCFQYKHDLSDYKERTYARGELNGHSKFLESDALKIIDMWKSGVSQSSLAIQYGVNPCTISRLVNGKRWSYLVGGVPSQELN